MPIQAPQWTDFLTCPICYHDYDNFRLPVSLACSHTVCIVCLSKLHRKQCPFDQTVIRDNIDNWPINYALLQLLCYESRDDTEKVRQHTFYAKNAGVVGEDISRYLTAIRYVEEIALFLKPSGSSDSFSVLSRPMQKRIITILNCQLLENEGRLRAIKAARSVGERTVTELLIQHQNPQQLSSNLWAAVRSRGCQFLGPAMQEEVLKLVLLALEDGSAISRKVLVMFIVQRLELQFPQASKTSIGHVVQLLYRASCFIVSKRESDSSLMRLKEEFRTYEALRREHDTQIVEIALEAGLRIAPDQWSALLYGDTTHKSHMQSIIDKLQTPGSFVQSVQELLIVLQRTGDPANLSSLRIYLEYLASIDVANECRYYDWEDICKALEAVSYVVAGLVNFMCLHAVRKNSCSSSTGSNIRGVKYKVSLCRDFMTKTGCPRGANCTFAHCEEELTRHRSVTNVKSPIHQYKDKPNEMFVEDNDAPQTSSDSVKNSDSLGINKYFLHPRNRSISTNSQLPTAISWPAYNSHDNITRAEDAEEISFNDNFYSLWNQNSETKSAVDFCTLKNAEEVLNAAGQESFYDVNLKPNLLSSGELNLSKVKNNPVDFDIIRGPVNENGSREFDGKILSKNNEYGSSAINNDGILHPGLRFDDSSLLFPDLCNKSAHSTCNTTLDPEFKYPPCILSHYQSSRQNMCENFSEPPKYSETENLQPNTATSNIYSPLEIIKDMKKLELFYEEKK